jgi:NADPH2:quinone reductase
MAVSSFQYGHGSFARECLAGDNFALPVPPEMADADAAGFLIPFHTGWVGLARRGALQAGETLLVFGAAGGTGSAAVQLGKAFGATVIATAGGADKAAFCRSLGADHVIDYRTEDVTERVREITAGRGADIVYDPVGGEMFRVATQCVAHEGRVLPVGFAAGEWGQPSVPHIVQRNYSVVGVMPGAGYDRAFKERAHEELMALWRAARLRPPIHRVLPFAQVPDAVAEVAEGRVKGKVVVAVG